MRISDWSSDVCSSDLTFLFADEPMVSCRRRRPCAADRPGRGSASPARHGQCRHHVFSQRLNARTDRLGGRDGLDPYGSSASLASLLGGRDRKSTRLNSVTNAQLVCRPLLEKKKNNKTQLNIAHIQSKLTH